MKCTKCGLSYTGDRCIYCPSTNHTCSALNHSDTDMIDCTLLTWGKIVDKMYESLPKPKEGIDMRPYYCQHCGTAKGDLHKPGCSYEATRYAIENWPEKESLDDILTEPKEGATEETPECKCGNNLIEYESKTTGICRWCRTHRKTTITPRSTGTTPQLTCYHCGEARTEDYLDNFELAPGFRIHATCAIETMQYLSQACKAAKLKSDNWNKEDK